MPRIAVLSVLLACIAVEAALQLAAWLAPFGHVYREALVSLAAFWPDRELQAPVAFPGQSVVTFVSYAFLHAGLFHLSVNMITLLFLGTAVERMVGARGFIELYAGSVVGGAIAYALLRTGVAPMVGASGGLFGLAGALLLWEIRDLRRDGASFGPLMFTISLLLLLNGIMLIFVAEQSAWQAHLGGFVVGFLLAAGMVRKSPHSV